MTTGDAMTFPDGPRPVWLEVALNGPWGREKVAGVPLDVSELIEDGIACVEAGAAIVHVHAFDMASGRQKDDPDLYAAIIEGIRAHVDAIVYPTIPLAGFPDQSGFVMDGPARFAHQAALAERGLLEWAVVDPGSVNIAAYEGMARDEPGFLYQNPEEHVRAGLAVADAHGVVPSYAIYEPGFLRLGAALARRYPGAGPAVYRFMFSDGFTFGFPPEDWALDAYLRLLEREAPGAPWMIAGLQVDISPLIPVAVSRGGHIRVGMEDAPFGDGRSNLQWVDHAVRAIEAAGGRAASAADVRKGIAAAARAKDGGANGA